MKYRKGYRGNALNVMDFWNRWTLLIISIDFETNSHKAFWESHNFSGLENIVDSISLSPVIDQFVVDCKHILDIVILAITPLLDVHLWDPVVGLVRHHITPLQ